MFTGIVQHVGVVKQVRPLSDNSIQIDVDCKDLNSTSSLGQSISIDGICLTVEKVHKDVLTFTAISETIDKTKLKEKVSGSLVNVEGSASMQDLVGGHPITGHIDTVGKIIDITKSESWKIIRISVDKSHRNLIVSKGSICIDGVSLTISNIGSVEESWFEVSLIPATLSHTTLDSLVVGNLVNIEFDQVGKYIAQNMQMQNDK
ncbi:riboflavin synthase [Actinomycetes bacterium]|jgi:riboflavin synthase|nr:riboflavin synthase [Actinomycetes bacterium]